MPDLGVYTWPFFLQPARRDRRVARRVARRTWHLEELAKSAPVIGVAASKGRRNFWLRLALGAILIFFGLRILHHFGARGASRRPRSLARFVYIGRRPGSFRAVVARDIERSHGRTRARVRMEERANVAAHLHDSVLQTLTLIERAAGDEAAVMRLARTQERELRQWLFRPERIDGDAEHVSSAICAPGETKSKTTTACASNSSSWATARATSASPLWWPRGAKRPSTPRVGRAPNSSRSTPRSKGRRSVSSFATRGRASIPTAVPADRQGIALSIRQRIAQRGGEAVIKSTVGDGNRSAAVAAANGA